MIEAEKKNSATSPSQACLACQTKGYDLKRFGLILVKITLQRGVSFHATATHLVGKRNWKISRIYKLMNISTLLNWNQHHMTIIVLIFFVYRYSLVCVHLKGESGANVLETSSRCWAKKVNHGKRYCRGHHIRRWSMICWNKARRRYSMFWKDAAQWHAQCPRI